MNGAQLYLGAAYTYHFKCSNGTHYFKTYNIGDFENTIDSLRQELAKKPKEVIKEVVKEVQVPAKTQKIYAGDSYIFFAQNSAELTSEAKAVLDNVEGSVDIIATASPEGSADYNQSLSERRAKAVADYLADGAKVAKSANVTNIKQTVNGWQTSAHLYSRVNGSEKEVALPSNIAGATKVTVNVSAGGTVTVNKS